MKPLGLILFLITVIAIAAPIIGVTIVYSDNLSGMIFSPEVEEVMLSAIYSDEPLEIPQYVSSSYNLSSRTAQVTFSFANPFKATLTLNSVSADLKCTVHNFALGHARLSEQVQLDEGKTENITIVLVWTEDAEEHFQNEHANSSGIDVDLVNIQIDISGISIEIPEQVTINLPIIE